MRKLLQRPVLKPEEWWDGYVARVLADNGHAPTREYMLEKLEPVVGKRSANPILAPMMKAC